MLSQGDPGETPEAAFTVGEWTVEPRSNRLLRGDQEAVIEPRYMDLLVFLASRADEVIAQDELIERVWQGQVVGDHSIYQGVARLRKALGDNPAKPSYIATVPKRGYRLVAQVGKVPSAPTASGATTAPPGDRSTREVTEPVAISARGDRRRSRWRFAAPGLAIAALATLAVAWTLTRDGNWSTSPRQYRSLAVLPFVDLSGDRANVYFAEGLSEELMNALGNVAGIRVVGRTSAFAVKGVTKDLRDLGDLLEVDAVVEGSVRKAENQLRITVKLVDTDSGFEIWGDQYDRTLQDIFKIQEEISSRIVEAMQVQLGVSATIGPAARKPESIQAYDYFLLGKHYQHERTQQSLGRSLDMFDRAIELEPGYSIALQEQARSQLLLAYYGDQALDDALHLAGNALKGALERHPDPQGLATYGLAQYLHGDYASAQSALERAVALSPNVDEAHMWLGLTLQARGMLDQAHVRYAEAAALNPLSVVAQVNLALSLNHMGRNAAAREGLERLAGRVGDSALLRRALSILAVERGDLVAAFRQARHANALEPDSLLNVSQLAEAESLLGRSRSALTRTRDALQAPAIAPDAVYRLGLVLVNEGQLSLLDVSVRQRSERTLTDKWSLFGQDGRWRRARIGLAKFLIGEDQAAVDELDLAIDTGIEDAIVRSDTDPLFCATLVHAHRFLRHAQRVSSVARHCQALIDRARTHGWDTFWISYAGAVLALAQGQKDDAVTALKVAFDKGLRAHGLLRNNRSFNELSDHPGYIELLRRMRAAVKEAQVALASE